MKAHSTFGLLAGIAAGVLLLCFTRFNAISSYAQQGATATRPPLIISTNTPQAGAATSRPATSGGQIGLLLATNTPRAASPVQATSTPGAFESELVTLTPSRVPGTLTPTASPTPFPTTIGNGLPTQMQGATWTAPPVDPSTQIADHYPFGRPISDDGANWADRTYPYGGTSGGRLQVHHGVDMVNPRGTPVQAVGDGVILFAGDDLSTLFGPYNNYYGNVVVIQHYITTFDGQPVFTLYGHLDRVNVAIGQAVAAGDNVGMVGGTGIAMGPHLHFEVRVGNAFDFGATRNPELWIRPYSTFGTLAGRVTDASGTPLYSVTFTVESTDVTRYAFSYADASVNPDTQFNENFVLGDLPASYYTVTVSESGRVRFREIVYLYANRTTWLDVQLN